MSKIIAVLNRRAMEASASREELQKIFAREPGLMPSRRYRVEGTRLGNSRLLTKQKAIDTKNKYGGEVCEIWNRERQAKEYLGCKKCKAGAGEPCRAKGGIVAPHVVREGIDDAKK